MRLVTSFTYLQLVAILFTVIDDVSSVGNVQWLLGTNTPLIVFTGHNAAIAWVHQQHSEDDSITIYKNNVSIATFLKDDMVTMTDDERYNLQKTQNETRQEITLTITNVTVEDSGIYRCYIDLLKDYKDIQLNITDFRWLKTRNPVKSTLRQDVELVWKYESSRSIHRIDIIRYGNNTNQVENIGKWTEVKGFVVDPFLSTEAQLGLSEERIALKFIQTIYKDFEKIYRCQVYYGKSFSEISEIQLIAERPTLAFSYDIINDQLHLVWKYRYHYPIAVVILEQKGSKLKELGFWYQGNFEIEKNYTGRLMFNKTMADIGGFIEEKITLTILSVTRDDVNFPYRCDVIPGDGQTISLDQVPRVNWKITISEHPPRVQTITRGDMINLIVNATSDLSLQYQWYFNNQAYDLIPYIDTRVLSDVDYRKVEGIYTLDISNIFKTVHVKTEIVLVEADPVTSSLVAYYLPATVSAAVILIICIIITIIVYRRKYFLFYYSVLVRNYFEMTELSS
ncbi:hypothetical protein SNE40_021506 [Patella caerulea]|uniref:Immunoglobulin V-set domain-containing protein n=1 Tax=Patella caerulea TaxID=87958 RepID=A0AAN8IWR7_PATCE